MVQDSVGDGEEMVGGDGMERSGSCNLVGSSAVALL